MIAGHMPLNVGEDMGLVDLGGETLGPQSPGLGLVQSLLRL